MRIMGVCPLCHLSEAPLIGSSVLLVLFCDCEACMFRSFPFPLGYGLWS